MEARCEMGSPFVYMHSGEEDAIWKFNLLQRSARVRDCLLFIHVFTFHILSSAQSLAFGNSSRESCHLFLLQLLYSDVICVILIFR